MLCANRLVLCLALGLLPLAGCAGAAKDPNRLPTKPVTVKVTYNGNPVEGAMVSFINEKAPAFGKTDAQGVAKMKTYEDGDGAVVGTHKVTVIKSEVSGGAPQVDQDSAEYDPVAAGAGAEIKYLVPQKYTSPATSGLTAEVTESGPNQIDLPLTD